MSLKRLFITTKHEKAQSIMEITDADIIKDGRILSILPVIAFSLLVIVFINRTLNRLRGNNISVAEGESDHE